MHYGVLYMEMGPRCAAAEEGWRDMAVRFCEGMGERAWSVALYIKSIAKWPNIVIRKDNNMCVRICC